MNVLLVLIGFFVGFVIAFLIFRNQKTPKYNQSLEEINSNKEEFIKLKAEKDQLDKILIEQKTAITKLNDENKLLNSSLVAAETNLANMNERLSNQKLELDELQKRFTLQFENLANKIFDEKTKTFNETNKQQLDNILSPLNENLKDFKNAVKNTYEKGLKERTEITTELKQIQRLNQQLQEEASNLTKALKGDSQKQGRWGEIILEKILESSGLEKGIQYKMQDSFTLESGKRLRPDAVIYLPEDKHIIVDSKVSLVAFEKFINADNEELKAKFIKEHIQSVRNHIKELSSKDYISNLGISTPEYLLMFIPVEASFSAAVSYDKSIFNEAWDNRIVIVSPSTLIATLMTISAIWKQTNQTKNALEIAERGGRLYDKFYGFIEDMEKIGASLDKASLEYDNAIKKLSTGSGSLIRQTEILRKLGAKTNKAIAKEMFDDDDNDDSQLPESRN